MKKMVKKAFVAILVMVAFIAIGFGIATAVYSSGMEIKVPHIQVSVEWSTIKHDLWLEHYSTTDSQTTAMSSTKQ